MLKLKRQYFGHLMQRTNSFEKTLMLGKIEGKKRRGWQRMRWLDRITDAMHVSLSKLRSWRWAGKPGMLQSMGSQRVGYNWATELNWLNVFHQKISDSKTLEEVWLKAGLWSNIVQGSLSSPAKTYDSTYISYLWRMAFHLLFPYPNQNPQGVLNILFPHSVTLNLVLRHSSKSHSSN